MAANPQIINVSGVPSSADIDTPIPLLVEMVNMGDEGDVYLNCWCADEGASPYYPDARGMRLQNWRPAAAGISMVYSGLRGFSDEFDPTGLGLCFGCNPDGDCWAYEGGKVTLRFECGYLTADPAGGWDLLHSTDQVIKTVDMGGDGFPVSWQTVALGGVVLGGLILLLKKK